MACSLRLAQTHAAHVQSNPAAAEELFLPHKGSYNRILHPSRRQVPGGGSNPSGIR